MAHHFQFRMDPQPGWSGVIDCEVTGIDPIRSLSYTWGSMGVGTAVTFTLTPTATGNAFACGAIGLWARSGAGFCGRDLWLEEFPRELDQVLSRAD
ncbi:MAG: hypothetical protein WDM89_20485 [Rhizomicrobium sp.]